MTEFHDAQRATELVRAELEADGWRLEADQLRRRLDLERDKTAELERALDIYETLGRAKRRPGWLSKPPKPGKHHGTWCLMLSDLHLDEVVNPSEINGVNAYNRDIALSRLKATFEGAVRVARDYVGGGVKVDGLICLFGGDIFSGIIHDELRRTNEEPILSSLEFWIDPMAQGLEMLADHFGKVHCPWVVGNHGRLDRKPVAKARARDNFDWFYGKALERIFRDDKRVSFDVSDSPDVTVPVYDQTILLTHGDQAKGGSGWGGIFSPIMRLDDRKSRRQQAVDMPYDMICLGHWHQLIWMPRGIVNGSLKGYDEYSFISNHNHEPPQQAMWLMTPEHGRTFTVPIFCQDPEAEGWR